MLLYSMVRLIHVALVISSMMCSRESYIFSAVDTIPLSDLGLASFLLVLAASSPYVVRCRVRYLSNCKSPAEIVSSRLPCEMVVSSHVSFNDFMETPASCILSMIVSNSMTEQPNRVYSVIITVSPLRSESIIMSSW